MNADTQKGFTIIELLIVFALVSIVGAFALLASIDAYRGSLFRSDRDMLVAALERARAESMNNVCIGTCTDGKAHGVAIRPSDNPNAYVIFQGSSYAVRNSSVDAIFAANSVAIVTGLNEVDFAQITGAANAGTVNISQSNHTSVISIGSEGQISWTN